MLGATRRTVESGVDALTGVQYGVMVRQFLLITNFKGVQNMVELLTCPVLRPAQTHLILLKSKHGRIQYKLTNYLDF